MNILLDINSDQRDPLANSTPQDYTITLNRPLYNVTNIRLDAAKIPISQTLINGGNNTFSMNSGQLITLTNRNYSNAEEFRSDIETQLQAQIANSNVDTVTFDTTTNRLTFSNASASNDVVFDWYDGVNGYANNANLHIGTPASIFGFDHANTPPGSNVVESGVIDLYPPTSIIIRISSNGTDFGNDVFMDEDDGSSYLGRILTYESFQGNEYLIYSGGYPIEEYFNSGPEKVITSLRIRFYYSIGKKLIPYDFGLKNHTIKFSITCNLDKLKSLAPPEISDTDKLINALHHHHTLPKQQLATTAPSKTATPPQTVLESFKESETFQEPSVDIKVLMLILLSGLFVLVFFY
jgi:hypothetical protein